MAYRYIRPPAAPTGTGAFETIDFWPIPEGTAPIDLAYCLRMKYQAAECMRRAMESGVV
jgi:hypothetical protein